MVYTRPPTSKSSRPFNKPLVTVPKSPITIGIIVTVISLSFLFQFSSKVEVLFSLFTFFQFYSVVSRDCKVDSFADFLLFFFFFLNNIRSRLLAEIRLSVCISKSHRSLCVSLWVFLPNGNWWAFTEVWMIASLLRSPELFLVFSSILKMLRFQFFLWFPVPVV